MTAPPKRILIFRPGVSKRRTVFENLLLLYREIARQSGAAIRLAVDESEAFRDPVLEVVTVPPRVWRPWRGRLIFPTRTARIRQLRELFQGADLVVTCDPLVYPQAELAIEAGRQAGVDVWVEATVTLLTEPNRSRWPHWVLAHRRKMMATIGRIVVPSPKVIERFQHHHLTDAATLAKFQVVGHPVDSNLFRPLPTPRPRRTILCVTRLLPEKGLAYIIEAFRRVLALRPEARLRIVGEGPMLGYLQKECAAGPLQSTVEFLPMVPHEQQVAIFQAADVFINHALATSQWEEYFGVSNLEAMACGLPIVVSRSGAIPWVFGASGRVYWTEERDVSGIVQNLIKALQQPPATEAHWVMDGHRYVQARYSPEACAHRWAGGGKFPRPEK